MKLSVSILCTLFAAGLTSTASAADLTNLKVIKADEKQVEKGMKGLSKGLGVKCEACHVKGDFAKDDVAVKQAARTFLASTVGSGDEAGRAKALGELLGALQLKKPKSEEKIWKSLTFFSKQ